MNADKTNPSISIIELPWMISTSVSNFRIAMTENSECLLYVNTFWGLHCEEKTQFRRVLIQFVDTFALYCGAFQDDDELGGHEPIDWSSVRCNLKTEAEVLSFQLSNATKWKATDLAPDSMFYKIIGSNWANRHSGARDRFKLEHYLLRGCDGFVEVLASGFSWSEMDGCEPRARN